MTTLAPMLEVTSAEAEACQNWTRNLAALRDNQPAAAALLEEIELDLEWVFARDGSLTGVTRDRKWWANCSLPLLAGRAVLQTLEPSPGGSCLLAPPHAGLVQAACEQSPSAGSAPLFVIQPDRKNTRATLCCCDFSEMIAKHRLWIITGENWISHFQQLLEDHPRLAMPTRFIKTRWTGDEILNPMITAAQEVLSAITTERAMHVAARQAAPIYSRDVRQILLVGGSEFRLWDSAAMTLNEQLCNPNTSSKWTIHRFDTDDARCGSPIALLDAIATCGSVVSANLSRTDSRQLVPKEMPWIIWITQPEVPAFDSAGPLDALVLADPQWRALARNAGWPQERVHLCGWPMTERIKRPAGGKLALICDTLPVEIPETVKAFSSHRLLWDLIEEELVADPLTVENIEAYLTDRAGQLNIQMDALDTRSFVEKLIMPVYQQGLARLLTKAKLPFQIQGRGWQKLPEFAAHYQGEITSARQLDAAVEESTALIYCWPERSVHPIQAMGRPVVYRSGKHPHHFIQNARYAITAALPKLPTTSNEQLAAIIRAILGK